MNFDEYLNQFYICDSHLHICDLLKNELNLINNKNYFCCSSSHTKEDFLLQTSIFKNNCSNIIFSFGIHPFYQSVEELSFLENLLEEKKINAIGEIGLDYFSPELRAKREAQIKNFSIQIELAIKYNLPIVIHARKSFNDIFNLSPKLKKVPSVIFHSYSGTFLEAMSIINHGINAAFSFSKQIIFNNKKSIECVKKLPIENILFETDAPFQNFVKNGFTKMEDILQVYNAAFEIRSEKKLFEKIHSNYLNYFGVF